MGYKLVCFDVDGTLVDNVESSWQLFHDHFKTCKKKRAKAKKDFYSGKINYSQWAQHDIDMWLEKKAKKEDFIKAIKNLRLMKGARETLNELKPKGIKLAIISGSLDIILEYLLPDYEEIFDDIFISKIFFNKDGTIKDIKVTEFDMFTKVDALKQIIEREGIRFKDCVFVGDHDNDVRIAKKVGLGIAFNCKSEELRKAADIVVKKKDLREILKYIKF